MNGSPSPFQPFAGPRNIFDPHDSMNWVATTGDFQVEGKHGNGWRSFLNIRATSDLEAARKCHKNTGYKTIRVRPAGFDLSWRVIKFSGHQEN